MLFEFPPFSQFSAKRAGWGRYFNGLAFLLTFSLGLVLCGLAQAQNLDMGQLRGVTWGSGNRNLVVILHGDGGPGRYDAYAASLAQSAPGTTVVALTRPGFRGATGRSPGNNPSRDHYTQRNNRLLAESLAAMRASLNPGRLIVVGHSGGSGQLGTIIGTHPGIVDVAILAACPCDVPNWRRHRRGQNNWRQSQSPHRFADRIPRSTEVYAITNQGDANTLVRFAQTYVQAAQAAGANITFQTPAGGSHGWSSYSGHVNAIIRANLR